MVNDSETRRQRAKTAIRNGLNQLSHQRAAAARDRLSKIPEVYQRAYIRAVMGKTSPRQAIRSFCLECVSWKREEVKKCTAVACPLWVYR